MVCTRGFPSKMRDKQDGGNIHYIITAGIRAAGIGQSMVKCNCHRLKYFVLYYNCYCNNIVEYLSSQYIILHSQADCEYDKRSISMVICYKVKMVQTDIPLIAAILILLLLHPGDKCLNVIFMGFYGNDV